MTKFPINHKPILTRYLCRSPLISMMLVTLYWPSTSSVYNTYCHTRLILDSQLNWESSKCQLARWSHRVVLLLSGTGRPADRPADRPTGRPTDHPTTSMFEDLYPSFHWNLVLCPHPSLKIWPDNHNLNVRCPPLGFSNIIEFCAVSPP